MNQDIRVREGFPTVSRRRENMVGVNMVGVNNVFHDTTCEFVEGIMLEACLLQPCFHVAGTNNHNNTSTYRNTATTTTTTTTATTTTTTTTTTTIPPSVLDRGRARRVDVPLGRRTSC